MRSKPDGHTIFIHAGNTVAGNMHLIKKPPFDAAKAIQVAATINKQAFMLAVDAKRPWKTVAESDRPPEGEGRQGELRGVGQFRQRDGRDLQGAGGPAGGRGALPDGGRTRSTTWRAARSTTRCRTRSSR